MKKVIILLILIGSLASLSADTLVGQIWDLKTKAAVPNAAITIDGTRYGTNSDESGKFAIPQLKPQTYQLTISRIGYQTSKATIDLSQEQKLIVELRPQAYEVSGFSVNATFAKKRETPVTFSNIQQQELMANNSGQEVPMLLNDIPGVYAYTEAGGAIGNAQLKVRGFDQKRIGVMINGIPLNDPEDHGVYWVNMPDFAESTSNIQFQRGVGSSIYGISTFGGSLNMQTSQFSEAAGSEAYLELGSYNTYKYGAKTKQNFGNYSASFRLSRITSEGYRDDSASDLWSIFSSISYQEERSLTEINFYTGQEVTEAAWDASGDWLLAENHQHNPYSDQSSVDNFSQPHFEIHNSYLINEQMDIKNSIFYIRGKGFYEQYKSERDPWEHGLVDAPVDTEIDLIRQKWVTKNHYGLISNFNWAHNRGELTAGTYLSGFNSDHWGEIVDLPGNEFSYYSGQEYYQYLGEKQYATFFLNEIYQPSQKLSLMANLYFQHINYSFDQQAAGNFNGSYLNSYQVDYNFFNPRLGANFNLSESMNIYANYSQSHREPTDSELYDTWYGPDDLGVAPLFAEADTLYHSDGSVQRLKWSDPYVTEEKLQNYELGLGYAAGILDLDLNGYWMNFSDEIISFGGVNEEGQPIRGNAEKTIHRGVELGSKLYLPANLILSGNFSYSQNYFDEFVMQEEQWLEDENGEWYTEAVDLDLSGNTIAGFPEIIAGGKLAYTNSKLNIYTHVQYVGEQFLDNTENDQRTIAAYQVVNLGMNLNFGKILGLDNDMTFTAKINNLLDEEYETAGYYNAWGGADYSGANYYWPAAGRNFSAGIRVGF
ncbi:MAG: TonB-dependent receptor [Candidatus Cloacimonadales bacterium]